MLFCFGFNYSFNHSSLGVQHCSTGASASRCWTVALPLQAKAAGYDKATCMNASFCAAPKVSSMTHHAVHAAGQGSWR